jgi:hypothetical protein
VQEILFADCKDTTARDQDPPRNEVLLLNTGIQPPTVEVILERRKDEEDLEPFFKPAGGLVAVPFTWEQEFFVDAKMPNQDGAGPLGGAY